MKKVHPLYAQYFFEPFSVISQTAEILRVKPVPDGNLWEARTFAKLLRECNDENGLWALIQWSPETCGRFLRVAGEVGLKFARPTLAPSIKLTPNTGKPFATVADLVLAALDKIEAKKPGTTHPPQDL